MSASGEGVVSFAGNDYLGLSQHPEVTAAAHAALDDLGAGAGAARLIVGSRPVHDRLEVAIAEWKQRDAALLFSTGYQANLGLVGALAAVAPDALIHSDELNHASIIDGTRLARSEVRVFPHLDLAALDSALSAAAGRAQIVVSDEVFSMDGDTADINALAELCAAHEALLVLDVAHSVLAESPPSGALLVGTLSKTLGTLGGFVAGPGPIIDLCRNTARSFIFTTASTPADTAAAEAAIRIVGSPEGAELLGRLRSNVERLRAGHRSPIIPVVVGSEEAALAAAESLLAEGLLVPAIRPPTVAPGTCRLRIAVSAAHDPADVDRLADTLRRRGLHP
ncbi:MAG: aminotransferase class I/II-fold pyridoxal phosphate-dependent enzyme [Microthrixaceae bacterium]|nr:aminotransferase class I/II-fold pyridoxal phosphate-dependent enzyme [Microthrixaceae bacterium]